jgi:glycosyl hydrolase family 25
VRSPDVDNLQPLARAVSVAWSGSVVDDDSPAGLDQMLIDLLAGFVNKVRSFVFCCNNVACNELLMIRRIIDISHHEDPIDFEKVVANGIVAIIAKATQGATGVDPAYAKFKRAAAPIQSSVGLIPLRYRRECEGAGATLSRDS